MKKSVEIIGLPVISIKEGKELGTVKRLVIDPANGKVAALAVDDGIWYMPTKLLPYDKIAGVGEYAVTVDSESMLDTFERSSSYEKLLQADVQVIGTRVLTKAGRASGMVKEILIDDTGKIVSCEIDNAGDIKNLSGQQIVTFGKEVLIVDEEMSAKPFTGTDLRLDNNAQEMTAEKVDTTAVDAETEVAVTTTVSQEVSAPTDDFSRKFDERQRKYLLGKKAAKRIETENGMLIVDQGGEITEEVLQKAKLAGKFVELSMNIQ